VKEPRRIDLRNERKPYKGDFLSGTEHCGKALSGFWGEGTARNTGERGRGGANVIFKKNEIIFHSRRKSARGVEGKEDREIPTYVK